MKKNILRTVVILCIILFQLRCIYITVQYPFYGILTERTDRNEWVVTGFDVAMSQIPLDIKIGDVIHSINGNSANQHPTFSFGVVEQFHTLSVTRGGELIFVETDHFPVITIIDILGLIGELISMLIAIIIYNKISNARSARLLSVVFIFIGIAFMGLGLNGRGDVFGKYIVIGSVILIPLIFLYFLFAFFQERNIRYPRIPIKLYLSITILFIVLAHIPAFFNFEYAYFLQRNKSIFHGLPIVIEILILFYVLLKVYFSYHKERTYEATIIRTIWTTLAISLIPFIALTLIPQMFSFNEDKNAFVSPLITGWLILLFPVSFAYLIATRQLYNIPHVARRMIYAILISFVPSLLLIVTVALFDSAISFTQLIMIFILFMTILTFVFYSLEYFGMKLSPIVFPIKYQLNNSLKQIAQNLGSSSSFRDLKDTVLSNIVATLQVHGGAIVIKYKNDLDLISTGQINELNIVETLEKLEKTGNLEKLERSHTSDLPLTCIEITRHEEYVSYLVITRKTNGTLLSSEELQWLNLIVTYLAVSVENVDLVRKMTMKMQHMAANFPDEQSVNDLNWFRKMMFEFQEKERHRIATDLHDTTLQDLFFLKQRFRKVMEHYSMEQQDALKVQELVEYIEIINMNLRQSCFELNPHLLREIGLISTLEKLIQIEETSNDFKLIFLHEGGEIVEKVDMEMKRHLFRLVQELLNNARKHSRASLVTIEVRAASDLLEVNYTDDGIGFDPDKKTQYSISSSGMGMEQMKSRIYAMRGRYDLQTESGSGVKIRILFPLDRQIAG